MVFQDNLEIGDWVICDNKDNLLGQIDDIDDISVSIIYYDPDFEYCCALVNRYDLKKITKEVADIMRGV
jgi:hypothetical protein